MKKIITKIIVGVLPFLMYSGKITPNRSSQTASNPLPGQIMVDPNNESFLVYNRDINKDGKLDPYFMIGPGDPEGFFYMGNRKSDGTREGNRQTEIISRIKKNGGNAIYLQIVRSHGGDGKDDHNPWNDPKDPTRGLKTAIIKQWQGWLDQMREANITAFLFIYDDGSHPFDDGGCRNNGKIENEENNFIKSIVDAFKDYPNLIWIIQEEFKYVNRQGRSEIERKPCSVERAIKMKNLACLIKKYDDYKHIIGVHHNLGDEMHFPNDPNIDMYVQQADTRKGDLEKLHTDGVTAFDIQNRFIYVMGEAFDWGHKLMESMDRTNLRRSYYATALAGGYPLALGMFSDNDPSSEMLKDLRVLQNFFESTNFNEMYPMDKLKNGDTDWVLATENSENFILYGYKNPKNLSVLGVKKGKYLLKWMDPLNGEIIVEKKIIATGNVNFEKPKSIGEEAVLYIKREN